MTPEQLAAMGEPPSSVAYLTARQTVNIDGRKLWDCDFCGQKNVSWCNECGRCERLRGEGKASEGGPTVVEAMMPAAPTLAEVLMRGSDRLALHTEGKVREWLISQGWTPPPG